MDTEADRPADMRTQARDYRALADREEELGLPDEGVASLRALADLLLTGHRLLETEYCSEPHVLAEEEHCDALVVYAAALWEAQQASIEHAEKKRVKRAARKRRKRAALAVEATP